MKLTSEVKEYIRKRLSMLISEPVQEGILEDLKTELDAVCKKLDTDIKNMLTRAAADFVELHPEMNGVELQASRYGEVCVGYNYGKSELYRELVQAKKLRDDYLDMLEAMAHIDASNCKSSTELDERLVELVKR